MLWVPESQFIGDLAEGFTRIEHALFGDVDQFELDVFLRCLVDFFDQVAEIVGRQVFSFTLFLMPSDNSVSKCKFIFTIRICYPTADFFVPKKQLKKEKK